jgi:hypothetical protein
MADALGLADPQVLLSQAVRCPPHLIGRLSPASNPPRFLSRGSNDLLRAVEFD